MSAKHLIVVSLASILLGLPAGHCPGAEPVHVRDRLWVWGHYEGVYNGAYGLPGTSRITPIEGAAYLGVRNLIFVRYQGKPAYPWDQYAIPFRSLDRVIWSATGAGGQTSAEERLRVLKLAATMPNLGGLFLDDFFKVGPGHKSERVAALSLDELQQLRQQMVVGKRRLDLGVTLYTHQFDPRITPYLELCDVVSVWTWKAADLAQLEDNMNRFRKLAPRSRTLLGLYLWDFGTGKPMPLPAMQHQCELGLKWLRAGQVEGLILLGTNVCDLGLETVEWTRGWVARVGNEPLALPGR